MKTGMQTLDLVPGDMIWCDRYCDVTKDRLYGCQLAIVVCITSDVLIMLWHNSYTDPSPWIIQDYEHLDEVAWLKDFTRGR